MSSPPPQDMDIEHNDHIDADDVHGAQQLPSEQEHDPMQDAAESDFDRLQRQFARLSAAEQQLLLLHMPAPLGTNEPSHADLMQQQPMQSMQQPMQRPAERAIPPPEPKYDGSTSWPIYSVRVQQWLTACSTPAEQWALRAFACLTGAAGAYLHHELQIRNLSYYDLQIDPTSFTWRDFDAAMRSGNFGSPPTDDSVRSKLLSFQQLRVKGQYNTAQHISKVLLILDEAPNHLDDHTAIWLIRRTLYPKLQEKVQLTAADQPFDSLQQFLAAVRHLGPVTDREEHEASKSQPKQQQQAGFKRPYLQGPGAAPNPAAAAAAAGSSGQGSRPPGRPPMRFGQPRQPQQQQQQPPQQGMSPHAGKFSFNPSLSPAEVSRRRRENRCFHCGAPCGSLTNHAPDCKFRREREQANKRQARG